MRNSRHFIRLAKSKGARALAALAVTLLVMEPYAFALSQIVSKYPTGYTITNIPMGDGMTLDKGVVFGFNSAKSAADGDAYSDLQEAACMTPATNFTFATGMEGFSNVAAAKITYNYSGTEGNLGAGSIYARYKKSNIANTFQWNKSFFWDCGTPTTTTFTLYYKTGTWASPNTTAGQNNFQVNIVKPDLTVVNIVAQINLPTGGVPSWTQATGTIPAGTFNLPGSYTLRLNGALRGANNGADLNLFFDDVNLTVASGYVGFKQETEFAVRATPYSALPSNQYLLDIRARQQASDTENIYIQVWNGATWNTRYTVSSPVWTTFNSYYLTTAEYNGGDVRVRYVDADQSAGDTVQGGAQVEYQRVTVDQGVCVDQVTDQEADCGKCHNYGGDITKPWPTLGMHNKHAQSESASDCLWCHPDNGVDSAHRDGSVVIDGTIVSASGTPANGGTANSYNPATKTCSNIYCHDPYTLGQSSPAWNSVYGVNIERNCARCHNQGTVPPDNAANLNLSSAWPSNGDGGGHASHNTAFVIDEYSCQTNGSCHPDNRGQHSVVGDGVVVVKMAPNFGSPNQIIKYLPDTVNGTGTCANVSCHGGQQTPRFNLASTNPINVADGTLGCPKCHVPEEANGWGTAPGNASQYNAPISGLHRGSPPTSGKNHVSDYSCTKCHNASPTKHFQNGGVTNLDSTTMDTVTVADLVTGAAGVGTFTAGTGTSPNYTTPPTCATPAGTAGCHAEADTTYRNPATSWARKWSWDAYDQATPVNQCKNCHGHWGSFVAGVVEPHVTSNADNTLRTTLISNHMDDGVNCATMCHGQTDPLYNHGAVVGSAKDMTYNTNANFVDNGSTVGCNFCHANNDGVPDGAGGTHTFTDATWVTAQAAVGPTPTCYNPGASASCHGNGTNEYWPNGSAYPDREGRHDEHMAKIAAKLVITLPGTDLEQKRMCQYCHPANPGAAGHADQVSPADVNAFNPIWDVANPPATTDSGSAYTAANGTCASIDCHNNKTTTAGTYGWRDAGVSACLMCHNSDGTGTNNPTTGLHFGTLTVSANTHDDNFQITKGGASTATCTTCHTTTPSTAHINGTFTNSSPTINFAATVGFTDAATPTCTPNGALSTCHTDGGSWTRKWSTTAKNSDGTECANCHGGFSGSDWTFGVGAALDNVTDNNVSHSRDWDGDATQNETYGNHSGNSANTNKCNTCHVYGDPNYVWGTHHNNGTIQMNSTTAYSTSNRNCTSTCHSNNTGHNLEASGLTVTTLAGPALTCTGCHGGGSPSAGVSSASPHVTVGRGAGYNTFVACTECHPGGLKGAQHAKSGDVNVVAIANDATVGINYSHLVTTGVNGFVLGGDKTTGTTEAEICWNCHTNDTYNLSVTKTTITFVDGGANNDTIVDSASGLGGFAVGKLVTITGSSQAGNNKTFPIVAVAANSISVPPGSLTADGTAGESVTLRERVSEWGVNADTNGAANNYSYGGLYTSSAGTTQATPWATATSVASNTSYWISDVRAIGTGTQSFAYKTGRTQSTHAASSSGVSGLDAVANIRCSYCHDVHNTKTGSPTGAPYLRGTWMGNPYREDGAPQAGQTYATSATDHGSVPRATTATTTLGGYQIDQNNGNPTTGGVAAHTTSVNATWALANSAGLCVMCHTEGVDNLNKFGTATNAWMGANGHSNAAIGGTGANKVNIFRMSGADATYTSVVGRFASSATAALYTGSGSNRGAPRISFLNAGAINDTTVLGDAGSDYRGYGFRSQDSGGFMLTPQVTTGSPYAYNGYNWGAHADDSAAQTQYHKFSCSKCHNPHASRLPRLMISNCLDTKKNTWDDALSTSGTTGSGYSTENASAKISQWTSAQNCHRLKNTAQGAGARGAGWNKVTPWTTEGTQDNGVIP